MAAYASQNFAQNAAPATMRFNAQPGLPPSGGGPPGTFAPGTKVQIGNHRVVVDKYLSEGGFAHVYVVRLPKPVDGSDLAVLKRVAVPDKEHLANMRTEVETMKKLKGHRHIVTYIDSHASQLKGGGYEVFLLMEFCSGGGLIDFMNTRLQNRLTEPEILHIFSDIAEGVATMHYLRPPLLHRDLKVENVLITSSKSSRIYKVCDFGSTAPPRPAATSAAEGRLIEDDVQRHTTLQYRSPEMIDVYRRQPIDEKSDIWALGVLLYKLCYYTTPFEEVGQMAILNASFKYPSYPPFSDRLKLLIAWMLKENPQKRPNIYQVLREACSMRGKEVPIKDIYSERSASEARRNQQLPPTPADSQARVGAAFSPPVKEVAKIPEIAPMRRGRPTQPTSQHTSAKPSPSPMRDVNHGDPFAALDGRKAQGGDELSARFPKLDEFSLLQDSSQKFEFEPSASDSKPAKDLSERVTMALADDAFASPPSRKEDSPASLPPAERPMSVAQQTKALESKSAPPKQEIPLSQPVPKRPSMISTGTMTSPSPPSNPDGTFDKRPIHRFPPPELQKRPSSQPWADRIPMRNDSLSKRSNPNLPSMATAYGGDSGPRSPASSRPSLEISRPTPSDVDPIVHRSRSVNARRPNSIQVPPKREPSFNRNAGLEKPEPSSLRNEVSEQTVPDILSGETDNTITSDMDFLRVREEEESGRKKEKRISSGSLHMKRASLPSVSLLAGRFGEAFRKFEGGRSGQKSRSPSPQRIERGGRAELGRVEVLTPISGSAATGSDDDFAIEESEDVSPEVRRELERRRLSMEEKRVANAAAEYKRRVASQGGDGGRGITKAQSIQNKVQSLLMENEKPATKTATGYGRYTDTGNPPPQVNQFENNRSPPPLTERTPIGGGANLRKVVSEEKGGVRPTVRTDIHATTAPPTPKTSTAPSQRPLAPPKPRTLRTGQADQNSLQPINRQEEASIGPNDDWESNFNKRYPSLSGLEMVETEIDRPKAAQVRMKEV